MGDVPALLDGIRTRMHHLSDRQRVIAQNIANSETPGYKSREVETPSFAGLVRGGNGMAIAKPRVQLTDAMKGMGAYQPKNSGLIFDKDITETKPDGNNVTLEDQLMKMGETQADFVAMTSLYRKNIAMMKSALGRGSG